MVRWVFIVVLGLVAVGSAVGWGRSYRRDMEVDWGTSKGDQDMAAWVACGNGQIHLCWSTTTKMFPPTGKDSISDGMTLRWQSSREVRKVDGWQGFCWERWSRVGEWYLGNARGMHLALPMWLTSMGPAMLAAVLWSTRRVPVAGCCRRCRYDLRASPGRCPECGQQPRGGVETPTQGRPA